MSKAFYDNDILLLNKNEKYFMTLGLQISDCDEPEYFCTPQNAVIIGSIGMDGIHFCLVDDGMYKSYWDSPVYVVSPELWDRYHYVEPIANNFMDFIGLLCGAKNAGALEYISYSTKLKYLKNVKDILECENVDREEIDHAVACLKSAYHIEIIPDVYDYVCQVQENWMLRKRVRFTEEFFDCNGCEPDEFYEMFDAPRKREKLDLAD